MPLCEGQRAHKSKMVRGWSNMVPCGKLATVERDGHHWCATHDPEAVKRRQEITAKRVEARYQGQLEAARRESAQLEWVRLRLSLYPRLKALLNDVGCELKDVCQLMDEIEEKRPKGASDTDWRL